MKYVPKYCIRNFRGEVLVRTDDHSLKLVSISEEDIANRKEVCYFNSTESAEELHLEIRISRNRPHIETLPDLANKCYK